MSRPQHDAGPLLSLAAFFGVGALFCWRLFPAAALVDLVIMLACLGAAWTTLRGD